MLDKEDKIRKELVKYGIKLIDSNLVQGTWGNISIRLDDKYMICTPSGRDYLDLSPSDMVKVNIDTLEYSKDENKPTSEKGFHAQIYKEHKDAGAVIHTHSTYSSIYAASKKDMSIKDQEAKKNLGDLIKCAKYGRGGSTRLKKNVVKALKNSKGCFMAHHGMVCFGENIEEAFKNCNLIENLAKENIEKR